VGSNPATSTTPDIQRKCHVIGQASPRVSPHSGGELSLRHPRSRRRTDLLGRLRVERIERTAKLHPYGECVTAVFGFVDGRTGLGMRDWRNKRLAPQGRRADQGRDVAYIDRGHKPNIVACKNGTTRRAGSRCEKRRSGVRLEPTCSSATPQPTDRWLIGLPGCWRRLVTEQ
jgi:hypothetical protein